MPGPSLLNQQIIGQEVKQETKESIKLEKINSEEGNESSTEENFIILSDEEHAVDKRYVGRLGNDSHVGSCEYHDFK